MFLRKDAKKYLDIRVDELIRKTTIYAKIALINNNKKSTGAWHLPIFVVIQLIGFRLDLGLSVPVSLHLIFLSL